MTGSLQGNPGNAIPVYSVLAPGGAASKGYQQITGMSAATNLTVPTGAVMALIEAEAQAVRWRDDGTAPTGSVGMPLASGGSFVYSGSLSAIQFIQQTSGAILNVTYF